MGVTVAEVAKHNTKDDMWVIVEGNAYNVTHFAKNHPGGTAILQKVAGTDATKQFLKFHPTSVLRMLEESDHMGPVTDLAAIEEEEATAEEKQLELNSQNKPHLSELYNLFDFEEVAKRTLNRIGWNYYSSGADDEITLRENHRAFQRIWFRPRILIDVSKVDQSTTMLGVKSSSPFYITATALARLGHPDGETCLTRAAGKTGIVQMLSTLASCSVDEVAAAAIPGQPLWLQVYVNSDRQVTKEYMQHAEKLGVKGFFVTVDAPQLGRREKDMRYKYDVELADVQGEDADADRSSGAARAISSFIDTSLSWKDIPFLRSCTKQKLVIKGVQRWEDAVLAAEAGLDGIILSNHGGRQLEFARSGIEILVETMAELRKRRLHNKIEVYLDGGVRRGTDVIKALCLGAKGVGLGRPFLYAMSSYGEAGVTKAIRLLQDEIEMNMRLLGVNHISDLNHTMVDARNIGQHDAVPADYSTENVYERLPVPQFKNKL